MDTTIGRFLLLLSMSILSSRNPIVCHDFINVIDSVVVINSAVGCSAWLNLQEPIRSLHLCSLLEGSSLASSSSSESKTFEEDLVPLPRASVLLASENFGLQEELASDGESCPLCVYDDRLADLESAVVLRLLIKGRANFVSELFVSI